MSDLLTAFTIPFTAMDAYDLHWPLVDVDENLVMCRSETTERAEGFCGWVILICHCRLVRSVPCVAVYMSSLTIIGIAFDRHRVICKPTYRQVVW